MLLAVANVGDKNQGKMIFKVQFLSCSKKK